MVTEPTANPLPAAAPAPAPGVETAFLCRANLTREEARERSALVAVHEYDVHVEVRNARDPQAAGFGSTTTLTFSCTAPGSATFLDFVNDGVESVTLNGRALDPAQVAGRARILLPDLAAENRVTVVGRALYSTSGEGMHRFVDPCDGQTYLYTQYEPADARRVFACFEQPDLKGRFTFHLTGPVDWVLASNQPAAARRDAGEGMVTVDFSPTPPLSTYITTLLAGPYAVWEDRWDGHRASGAPEVPLALYCRRSLAGSLDAERIFATTRAGLDFFHELFGVPYPWGRYGQAFVPEYNLGAMENPGLVTLTEQYVFTSRATAAQYEARATTIMHEMAHMWFGDLVTMRWWDDLWLKESFADYMGTLAVAEATEFTDAWTTFASRRKAWAYVQDRYPTTHPIVADIGDLEAARQNFDGITYAKGASVLKQLVAFVGREAFMAASRRYFARYAWGTAELADFLAVLEEASGLDMAAWSRAWLRTSGVPRLWLEQSADEDGALALRQDGTDPATGQRVLRPHVLKVGRYVPDARGVLVRVAGTEVTVPAGTAGERTAVGTLGRAGPDDGRHPVPASATGSGTGSGARLLLVNDEDLTYAGIRLDGDSLAAVLEHPVEDGLARATVWAALWTMTRDGHLPAQRFVDAVARLGPAITDMGVYGQVVEQAVTAVRRFTPAARREQVRQLLGEALLRALAQTGPGSDRQRCAVRAFTRLARGAHTGDPGRDEVFRPFLTAVAGGEVPERAPGLGVDAEVRWLALIALAAWGDGITREHLDAELRRDISARTTVWHRTACAAIPDPAVREATWEAVLSGRTAEGTVLSNDHLSATAEGFTASRSAFEAPYAQRFWPELEQLWASRSNGLASRTIRGLFPSIQDAVAGGPRSQDAHPVVQDARRWLDGHPAAPDALRRIIVEELDEVRRSLLAQAAG